MNYTSIYQNTDRLLGQNPSASTKYVSNTEILQYANEAVSVMCDLGKVLEKESLSITLVTTQTYYDFPSEAAGSGALTAIEIIDVINASGESLPECKPQDRGKLFAPDSGTPLWWWTFASKIGLHPTPVFTGDAPVYTVLATCHPLGSLVESPTSNDYDDLDDIEMESKHQYLVPIYCAAKGKIKYRLPAEAEALITQFGSALNLNMEELKARIGL